MDFPYHDESNKVSGKWKQLWSLNISPKVNETVLVHDEEKGRKLCKEEKIHSSEKC